MTFDFGQLKQTPDMSWVEMGHLAKNWLTNLNDFNEYNEFNGDH